MNFMNLKSVIVLATAIMLTGCNAGPNYQRPRMQISANFSTWPSTRPYTPPTQTVVSTHTAPLIDLAHWWQSLHDPELDSLLDQIARMNMRQPTPRGTTC